MNVTGSNFLSLNMNKNIGNVIGAPYVLCLPPQCPYDVVSSNMDTFSQLLDKIIEKFPNAEPVEITSVYDPISNGPSFGVGATFVFILVILFLISGVTGSIIAYKHNEKKRKHKQLKRESEKDGSRSSFSSNFELPKESKSIRLAKGLSLLDNFVNLFTFTNKGHVDLSFLNGCRFVLICWIIWGNSGLIRYNTIKNVSEKDQIESTAGYSTMIAGAPLAVDTFFAISGFLLAIKVLERFSKKETVGFGDFMKYLAHRILRLWPVYIVTVLIYWQLIPFTGQAPMWDNFTDITSACSSNIWANILLVNNLAIGSDTQGCFEWGWVVASEVQFCIVGLILLFLYKKNKMVATIGICALFSLSSVLSIL